MIFEWLWMLICHLAGERKVSTSTDDSTRPSEHWTNAILNCVRLLGFPRSGLPVLNHSSSIASRTFRIDGNGVHFCAGDPQLLSVQRWRFNAPSMREQRGRNLCRKIRVPDVRPLVECTGSGTSLAGERHVLPTMKGHISGSTILGVDVH